MAQRSSPARVSRPLDWRRAARRVIGYDDKAVSDAEKKPEPTRHRITQTMSEVMIEHSWIGFGVVVHLV